MSRHHRDEFALTKPVEPCGSRNSESSARDIGGASVVKRLPNSSAFLVTARAVAALASAPLGLPAKQDTCGHHAS